MLGRARAVASRSERGSQITLTQTAAARVSGPQTIRRDYISSDMLKRCESSATGFQVRQIWALLFTARLQRTMKTLPTTWTVHVAYKARVTSRNRVSSAPLPLKGDK